MINLEREKQTVDAQSEKSRREGFAKFLQEPLVKVMLSRAKHEDEDGLKILLQAAFDSGHSSGVACVLLSFLEDVYRKRGTII